MSKDIEELEEDNVEIEVDTRFNLYWSCPNCKEENAEYDIEPESTIKCICDKCNKEYEYYASMY